MIGQEVDLYLVPAKKDLVGWRGPGRLIEILPEGRVTVRWQSHTYDLPLNKIRPHMPPTGHVASDVLQFYEIEPVDDDPLRVDRHMETLMRTCNAMQSGSMQLHAIRYSTEDGEVYTNDAIRDDCMTYHLAQKASAILMINTFEGMKMGIGVKGIAAFNRAEWQHIILWPKGNIARYQVRKIRADWSIDLAQMTSPSVAWQDMCFLIFY